MHKRFTGLLQTRIIVKIILEEETKLLNKKKKQYLGPSVDLNIKKYSSRFSIVRLEKNI